MRRYQLWVQANWSGLIPEMRAIVAWPKLQPLATSDASRRTV